MYRGDKLFKCGLQLAFSQCRFYRSANPGIGRRLKIFKEGDPSLSQTKLTEKDFDEPDVDVMDGALIEEYEKERKKISNRIAYQRIQREYFDKSKSPNFLLWSEKEQIRHLHHSEPDKWTHEALSRSFPATTDVIKKILKAQWKIKDALAIKRHDEKVNANWKALAKGKLELSSRTAEHLSKFTARRGSLPQKDSKDLALLQDGQPSSSKKLAPTKSTQFISIVKKQTEESLKSEFGDNAESISSPKETYVLGGDIPNRHKNELFTLSQMRKSGVLPNEADDSGTHDETISEPAMKSASKPTKGILNPTNSDSFSIPRYANASSTTTTPNDEPCEDIPMKITIPKEKWKKGAVYKVNNCFYADDGEFLYKI